MLGFTEQAGRVFCCLSFSEVEEHYTDIIKSEINFEFGERDSGMIGLGHDCRVGKGFYCRPNIITVNNSAPTDFAFAFPSWLSSRSILTMFSRSYVHNQKTPSQHSVDMPCLSESYSQHRVPVILCLCFLELLSSLLLLRFLFILTLKLQY